MKILLLGARKRSITPSALHTEGLGAPKGLQDLANLAKVKPIQTLGRAAPSLSCLPNEPIQIDSPQK